MALSRCSKLACFWPGGVDPSEDVRRQLSRWVRAGVVLQLRRGLYCLAPPFQKTRPHPFEVANRLVPGSYVKLQSALAHHGHIPEDAPVVTSVTLGRPGARDTPLGSYQYRHLARGVFGGYRLVALGGGRSAFVAAPGKALLDLVHLVSRGDDLAFLEGLRLQRLQALRTWTRWRRATLSCADLGCGAPCCGWRSSPPGRRR